MNTALTWQTDSTNLNDTLRLGAEVGRRLRGGECIELISDLGGGKTVFVRGLVQGAGSPDQVASPTFTVSREYRAKAFDIHHYDLYRLEETGVVGEELAEALSDPEVVVVIEWGAKANDILPTDRLRVKIRPTGNQERILEFEAGNKHKHLLKN